MKREQTSRTIILWIAVCCICVGLSVSPFLKNRASAENGSAFIKICDGTKYYVEDAPYPIIPENPEMPAAGGNCSSCHASPKHSETSSPNDRGHQNRLILNFSPERSSSIGKELNWPARNLRELREPKATNGR